MKKFLSVAALFCALCFFAACSKDYSGYKSRRITYMFMNTQAETVVYDEFEVPGRAEKAEEFAEEVKNLLTDVENSLSATKEGSFVTRFNAAAAGEAVEADEISVAALNIAVSVYELTDGYYNPAVYYAVQAYGFNGGRQTPPQSVEELPAEQSLENYRVLSEHFGEIEIFEEGGKSYVKKPDFSVLDGEAELSLKIDLGGIGKGYAADKIGGLFDEYGYEYGYFNFGTSSIVFKKFPGGDNNFTLELTDPRAEYATYFRTHVSGVGLSSSGDYENFFLLDTDGDGVEERFCHVFNPKTGKPVQTEILTATVIGGSAAENDAITTAIMAMGKDRAIEFISQKIPQKQVVFTCLAGEELKYYTNFAEGSFGVNNERFSPLVTE